MKRHVVLIVALACCGALLSLANGKPDASSSPADVHNPELAYLKYVNQLRPPSDPELHYILMGQFANAGRYAEGVEYFDGVLRRFKPALNDVQRAHYLIAIASLRAGEAQQISLLRRLGWMRETIALLDEAKRLTSGKMFVARWMSGVVRAQTPRYLGERDIAREDLLWCVEHADAAPHMGWLREPYFQLAALSRESGDDAEARRYQSLSGYANEVKPVVFTTPFASDAASGHTFSPRKIRELVLGRVYLLSGFEFTEYYFVVSADRQELIAIDAGTRADSAQTAHEALRAQFPGLPPLTTVLITHAHWDHVGGYRYFRGLTPAVRFIGRSNYQEELAHDAISNRATLQRFFGQRFRLEDVLNYKPDMEIEKPTTLVVGGTTFELLPARGGETDDAMFVHMPAERVLFVGDVLMPYFGAPFTEEGSVDGLLDSIQQIDGLQPRYLLHGHEPLTRIFSSTEMLNDLRVQLVWLRDEVRRAMREGRERGEIQQANLIPPTLARSPTSVHLAYLVQRENLINRVFDQNSGYWQNGMQGLDALASADYGEALLEYLDIPDSQLIAAIERMQSDGRHELAAALLRWTHSRLSESPTLATLHRTTYLKLMEKYQEFNPFKFILYAGEIDQPTAQINEDPTRDAGARTAAAPRDAAIEGPQPRTGVGRADNIEPDVVP
jgi:glyoxylase-like metal-dependent hydrolase (beta-lactamase superfamily II)